MKPRQLLLSAITTLLMATAGGQGATAQTLQVHHADGTTTDHVLGAGTKMLFQDDRVLLASPSQTLNFAKSDVLAFTYHYSKYDLNGDNVIDKKDLTSVIETISGLHGLAWQEADVNGDGAANIGDIIDVINVMANGEKSVATYTPTLGSGTIGDAFFIYRNDGQFNAFFREEIDSIGFSHYDADSLRYNKIALQVVYTPDSTYMIPLMAIDSVGFVQPETIVSDEVFPLTAEHSPYISDADTLKFTMSASASVSLLPKVGNIVVATADCDAFPNGIIARVEQIKAVGNGFLYECSKAYIEEVFEQLVVYTNGRIGEGDLTRRDGMRKVTFSETLWNEQWTRTITGGGTSTTLNVGDQATATVTVCKTLTTPFFFQLQLRNSLTTSVDFTAESTASIYKELQIGKTITAGKIPIPYTLGLLWLEPKLSLYGYFDEQGKVELNYSGHFNRTDQLTFTYTQHSWTFDHTPTTEAGTDVAKLSMEGSAEIGLKPQIDFSLNGQQAGFGLSGRLGLKEYINFVFDATQLSTGGLYDAMRDSYCRTTIPWSINVHANANIFSRYDGSQSESGRATFSHTFAPKNEPQLGEDRYIFPLFGGVEGKRQGDKATAKATISRTTLLPVQVGFSLIDKDKNIVQTKYYGRSYTGGKSFSSYSCELSGLEGSDKYTVRPSVRIFGQDVLASPEAEVKAEETFCPDSNHPHWIDLGIGTQWRCCNAGASSPEDYGGYYTIDEAQAYNPPSLDQIKALVNNCSYTWTTQNGVRGGKFTGPNGGTIFLPAAGYRYYDASLLYQGTLGLYWSATVYPSSPPAASYLYFHSGGVGTGDYYGYGRSVRPVR